VFLFVNFFQEELNYFHVDDKQDNVEKTILFQYPNFWKIRGKRKRDYQKKKKGKIIWAYRS
jgi:hypothetical protein